MHRIAFAIFVIGLGATACSGSSGGGSSGAAGSSTTSSGSSATSGTGSSGSSGASGASATSGGSSSSGGPYVWDGGNLLCEPPADFTGNSLGIGGYCDQNDQTTCTGNSVCTWTHGYMYNFCVYLNCDTTSSSSAITNCGPGTCCINSEKYTNGVPVCVPLGCLEQFDAGACPMP